MRLVVRTLMFLACMLYGAMPAQSALSLSMPDSVNMHVSDMVSEAGMDHGDPCPHSKTMTHAPFCAACLLLIPELRFAEKGQSPYAYPVPDLHRAFMGTIPAPPLPPPRA